MNLQDFNNLRFLDLEIREYRKAAREQQCSEQYRQALDAKAAELMVRKQEAFDFISRIEDSQTRQIIFLRFIKGLSWGQVAVKIGGGNTDEGVRKRAVRYIRSAMSAEDMAR